MSLSSYKSHLGISGIYSKNEYEKDRPQAKKIHGIRNRRFAYFRAADIDRALTMKPVDVLLLHEWPNGITRFEDNQRFRRWWRENGSFSIGNEKAQQLVNVLQPQLVLCGHMHFPYRTTIEHDHGVVTRVCCLGIVKPGDLPLRQSAVNWLAVFRIEDDGSITEVTDSG